MFINTSEIWCFEDRVPVMKMLKLLQAALHYVYNRSVEQPSRAKVVYRQITSRPIEALKMMINGMSYKLSSILEAYMWSFLYRALAFWEFGIRTYNSYSVFHLFMAYYSQFGRVRTDKRSKWYLLTVIWPNEKFCYGSILSLFWKCSPYKVFKLAHFLTWTNVVI